MKKRIAVLFHENDRYINIRDYVIAFLADYWVKDGNEVTFVFGTQKFVPANIAILHVNLSVVPDEYLEFAKHYPIVLNGRIKDIRKSAFSRRLLARDDPYQGKVIVKTDLNSAGGPERYLNRSHSLLMLSGYVPKQVRSLISRHILRTSFGPLRIQTSTDYHIYDSLREVPRSCFDDPALVVEEFLPEREKGLYCMRIFNFLGDRSNCIRVKSAHPIVKWSNWDAGDVQVIEPHPDVVNFRNSLGLDYGKLDYVVHDGEAIILDVNKTMGIGTSTNVKEMRAHRAAGIYSYFVK